MLNLIRQRLYGLKHSIRLANSLPDITNSIFRLFGIIEQCRRLNTKNEPVAGLSPHGFELKECKGE